MGCLDRLLRVLCWFNHTGGLLFALYGNNFKGLLWMFGGYLSDYCLMCCKSLDNYFGYCEMELVVGGGVFALD